MTEVLQQTGPTDGELLSRYAGGGTAGAPGASDAFAELVRRHVDLVYSAARSALRDEHLAEDVTQNVFLLLVRKAESLREYRNLGGWLFQAAVLEARNVSKKRSREARRVERLAQQSQQPTGKTDEKDPMRAQDWQEIEPHLSEALGELSDNDRDAVVLRYYQRRGYDWIAGALGVSEPTARQRVHRALEKLRDLLVRRGVTAGATASAPLLGAALKLHAVQPAPAALAAKTIAAAGQLSAALAAGHGPLAGLGPLKAKILAALLLGTAGLTVGVVAAVSIHKHRSESVYLDSGPAVVAGAANAQAPGQPAGQSGGVRRTFQVIPARTFDDHHGTKPGAGFIAYISQGDWLRFNRVDLGATASQPATFTAVVACPDEYAGNTIKVRADRLDGPVLGQLTVKSTGGYGNWRPQSAPLSGATGVHDLFLVFSGGGWNLDTFKVTLARRPGSDPIAAVSFNDSHGVQTRGGVVCETGDGSWVCYAGLDFGAGINSLLLTYACGNARPGGGITVRLDGPDGPVLGDLAVQDTGGWGAFQTRMVSLGKLTGSHDVVLVFHGPRHGIADLLALQFLNVNQSLTQPATQPATRPATQPTTQPAFPPATAPTTRPWTALPAAAQSHDAGRSKT